jgi:hypothetical protein
MSFETTALITLFFSSIGLGGIILRKIPVLISLPESDLREKKEVLVSGFQKEVKKNRRFKDISSDLFLEKLLMKIRSLSRKTDKKTFQWLRRVRKNSQRKKIKEDNDYWDEIKSITK